MEQKKLMLLGGIRYLLPVIETAHKFGVYVITADYLPDNIAHKYSDKYVNVSILDREAVFANCPNVKCIDYSQNRAYCPILFKDFETQERVYKDLKEKCNVYARRYFYPLLTDFAPYVYAKSTCPIAEDIAKRVLILPIYYRFSGKFVAIIAENIKALGCNL
jgi:dTDP-4-amino-4,6-dideoxygalactose transaminase